MIDGCLYCGCIGSIVRPTLMVFGLRHQRGYTAYVVVSCPRRQCEVGQALRALPRVAPPSLTEIDYE